jgi:hypothetical protein
MKTKELIRLLQEADPSGEIECCVGNEDIYFVACEPAYYDGTLQVLIRDKSKKDYNIIGAEFRRDGYKIQFHCQSIEDAIYTAHEFDSELPVKILPEYPEDSIYYNKRLVDQIERWRTESRQCQKEVDEEFDKAAVKQALKDKPNE